MENFMYSEIMVQPETVRRTLAENRATVAGVANCLKQSPVHSIYLVARGTSDHIGIYAKYLGEYLLGIPVCLAASSVVNLYRRPLDLSACLTLAISQSGEGPDVIGVVREAQRQQAPSVVITNYEQSTLAREADFALFCKAGEERSIAATKTCTTSMMAVAALLEEWSGINGRLELIPAAIEQTLTRFDEIGEKAKPFRDASHCVVLARGFAYGAALETALKIQETSYINARGFSTADFQHGPITMVQRGFPVIIYAFKGPSLAGLDGLVEHLKSIGAYTLLVTNDRQLLSRGDDSFYFPDDYPETITPYLAVVFGQIFAYHLALARGNNPDAPRGLRKVTKTL
jgi:glucosamine--fructose-6-phosphate aminotransferase (isomerizing)